MSLRAALWCVWMVLVLGVTGSHAAGAGFTATYRELARSPASFETVWYSGAVTKDGKFVYGIGHSHNAYGNNGLWLYDPATDTHKSIFPDTGNRWRWEAGVDKSGHWDDLDRVADRALYDFFGGPKITALTTRNNHQAFYLPARNEFWVLAGTTFHQSSPYFGGRFSLDTNRWEYLSKPWGEKTVGDLADFSAGVIAGSGGWVAPNAATAVCPDINTVVLFGGMSGTGGVRIIEPNPAGPEPYQWGSSAKPPFHHPAENVRHNAACVGDTVYFVEGQRRVPNVKCCTTPDPATFWKFHVPTRKWTQLASGPPGGYFAVLTYDSEARALVDYAPGSTGAGSDKLWVYDLLDGTWHDLTGTVPNLPRVDMHTGGYIPGFGHVYKGGRRFKADGTSMGYSASALMMKIALRRVHGPGAPAALAPPTPPLPPPAAVSTPEAPAAAAPDRHRSIAERVAEKRLAAASGAAAPPSAVSSKATAAKDAAPVADRKVAKPVPAPPPASRPAAAPRKKAAQIAQAGPSAPSPIQGGAIRWSRIPLPGYPRSPQGEMKHQRLVEGPGGRVYILGGDFGGGPQRNIGRQAVFSFDPLSARGDWRMEAPECGTKDNPVHWHTDEAGVAWDAKRRVLWKLAGMEYGPGSKDPAEDPCLSAGRSVKAKVIAFDPTTKLWTVPPHVKQTRFGYVTNGVIDPVKDELIQITDKAVKHLSLETGQWTSHGLPGDVIRFNAIAARVGRDVYWCNRKQVLESYNLDTHKMTTHSVAPWPVPAKGWEMQMVMPYGDKVLVVRPTSDAGTPRYAAIYDPAAKRWTTLDIGAGWGNTGMMHSSGKVILMGGGINGPAYHNKQVWVGELP